MYNDKVKADREKDKKPKKGKKGAPYIAPHPLSCRRPYPLICLPFELHTVTSTALGLPLPIATLIRHCLGCELALS